MCFYHDYEWHPEICNIDKAAISEHNVICDECGRSIPPGEVHVRVEMQQYEECNRCMQMECECPKDEDGDCQECLCVDPEFGEECKYKWCSLCDQVIDAIEAVEVSRGCKGVEARPAITELTEAMRYEDGEAYAAKALEVNPGLAEHIERLRR